jgi:hypothetical protein
VDTVRRLASDFPAERVSLIETGSLDDPAFVQAIREALKAGLEPWERVEPTALNALVLPTAKIHALGGTLDDLLLMLFDSLKTLQHPANRNFARQTSALKHVDQSLDERLRNRMLDEVDRGRRSIKSTGIAQRVKTDKADTRGRSWYAEVKARTSGPASTVHRNVARRLLRKRRKKITDARLKMETAKVKKAITRFLERHPSEKSARNE